MFLLDTNAISEIRKVRSGKAALNVARWAEAQDPDTGVTRNTRDFDSTGVRLLNPWLPPT